MRREILDRKGGPRRIRDVVEIPLSTMLGGVAPVERESRKMRPTERWMSG